MKKCIWGLCLLFLGSLTACNNDDEVIKVDHETGIQTENVAMPAPELSESELNTTIPNFSSYVEESSNGKVARISLTGIKTPSNEWMKLYGTSNPNQNIWVEIDGKPKGIEVVNSDELEGNRSRAYSKAKADVVFLIDDSGSMSEEADAVATQVLSWSSILSQAMDVNFGCVGYGDGYGIDGALDITDINSFHAYMNNGHTGTYRTQLFGGDNAEALRTASSDYQNGSYNECGALALRFADENFAFRQSANRIYVNMTDEPNQPNGDEKWSVEYVKDQTNWNVGKGTIHTVFSDPYYDSLGWEDLWYEKPWLMSEYTGGSVIYASSDFSDITLEDLEVTGAITNSYIIRLNITTDLLSGTHEVKITILSEDGTVKANKVFYDVTFAN